MSNNAKKDPRTKKQTTLGAFLIQNEDNMPALVKATLKRFVRQELNRFKHV